MDDTLCLRSILQPAKHLPFVLEAPHLVTTINLFVPVLVRSCQEKKPHRYASVLAHLDLIYDMRLKSEMTILD